MTSHNGTGAPTWRDVAAALESLDHPRGKLGRVASRFKEVYLHGYSADTAERLRISGGNHGDPTARITIGKQELRDDMARVAESIIHAAKVIDSADAFFARLCGETRVRREQRHRVGELSGNGQVSIEAGMKEHHRQARATRKGN